MGKSEKRPDIGRLCQVAKEVRVDIIRMLAAAGSGHPGGSLSAVEIIVALYFYKLRHDPARPDWPARDRFVLSKGHGAPALYAALAHRGYFPRAELLTLRQLGSRLQGHPDRVRLPGLDAATGSLGQGLSLALGMALAGKGDPGFRVFCLLGDGECQAGQVWEAAMAAGKFRLSNLIAIVDYNKMQLDGRVSEILDLEPLAVKWKAHHWRVRRIDGNEMEQVVSALDWAVAGRSKPSVVIADTIKGKGVSFMENAIAWHGKAPTAEQAEQALLELAGSEAQQYG